VTEEVPVTLRHIPDPPGIGRACTIVIANDGDTRVPVPGSTFGIEISPDAVRLLPC
jgi:hypothetical protein